MRQLLRWSLALLVGAASLSAAQPAAADEPQPLHRYSDDRLPPPQARVQLLLTGTAMFGLSYLPALGSSFLWPDHPGAKDLRIPVAGPWMMIGRTKLCDKDPNAPASCTDPMRIVGAVFAAFSGLAQAGGVFLITQSLFMKTAPLEAQTIGLVQTGPYRYSSLPYALPNALGSASSHAPHALPTAEQPFGALVQRGSFAIAPAPYSSDRVDAGVALSGTF